MQVAVSIRFPRTTFSHPALDRRTREDRPMPVGAFPERIGGLRERVITHSKPLAGNVGDLPIGVRQRASQKNSERRQAV